jgi:hypothetical protein
VRCVSSVTVRDKRRSVSAHAPPSFALCYVRQLVQTDQSKRPENVGLSFALGLY